MVILPLVTISAPFFFRERNPEDGVALAMLYSWTNVNRTYESTIAQYWSATTANRFRFILFEFCQVASFPCLKVAVQ